MALFWKRKETQDEFAVAQPTEFVENKPAPEQPVAETPAQEQPAEEKQAAGLFGRVKAALSSRIKRTKDEIVGQIRAAVKAAGKVDENLIERIEEILIKADVGAETTM